MGQFLGNPVEIKYTYGESISDTIITNPTENIVVLTAPIMTVDLFFNREYAHVYDKIQYKIVIANNGNVDLYNLYASFSLDTFLELEPNTLCVNGKRVIATLNNIPIPDMKVSSTKSEIIFTTRVIKSPMFDLWKVKSKATVHCVYNGNNSLEVNSNIVQTILQRPFKIVRLKETIKIPKVMAKINRIVCIQAYLLNVCPIYYDNDDVYIKISFATELFYRDCNMQKKNYYKTFEKVIKMKETYCPYVVCISVIEKENEFNHHEVNIAVGVSMYNRVKG